MNKIDQLNGYEFEELIANLFVKMGFSVEHTKLSGDGGIDIIARSTQPIFQGKYIIQCKRYAQSVGVSYVRDLYGVVLSESANKGILITNSTFSKQATEFAHGKNLELIDGSKLNSMLHEYDLNIDTNGNKMESFLFDENFNKDKYDFLVKMTEENKTSLTAYTSLINFMYDYVLLNKQASLQNNIFDALIELCLEVKKRFNKKSDKRTIEFYNELLCNLFLFKGDVYNSLKNAKQCELTTIIHTYIDGAILSPHCYQGINAGTSYYTINESDEAYHSSVYLINLLKSLYHLNFFEPANALKSHILSALGNANSVIHETTSKSLNREVASNILDDCLNKIDTNIYLPYKKNNKGYIGYATHYSLDLYYNINEIFQTSCIQYDENESEKIGYLLTMTDL